MGVQGLWTLLSPAAHTTDLKHLYGRRLAVDVSIWLHQLQTAVGGGGSTRTDTGGSGGADDVASVLSMEEHGDLFGGFDTAMPQGSVRSSSSASSSSLSDAMSQPLSMHGMRLAAMFHRVCLLLFHGIKPVFVFDGQTPLIKRRTVQRRARERRHGKKLIQRAAKKLLRRQLGQQRRQQQQRGKRTAVDMEGSDAIGGDGGGGDDDDDDAREPAAQPFRMPRSHLMDSVVHGPRAAVAMASADARRSDGSGQKSAESGQGADPRTTVDHDISNNDDDDGGGGGGGGHEWMLGGFFPSDDEDDDDEDGRDRHPDTAADQPQQAANANGHRTGSHYEHLVGAVDSHQHASERRIDPEVFDALPEDVRQQIVDDVRSLKARRRYASTESVDAMRQRAPDDFSSNQLRQFLANRRSQRSIEDIIIESYEPHLRTRASADTSPGADDLLLSMSGQLASDPDTHFAVLQRRPQLPVPDGGGHSSSSSSSSSGGGGGGGGGDGGMSSVQSAAPVASAVIHLDEEEEEDDDDDDDNGLISSRKDEHGAAAADDDDFVCVLKRDDLDAATPDMRPSAGDPGGDWSAPDISDISVRDVGDLSVELTLDASMFDESSDALLAVDDIFNDSLFEPASPGGTHRPALHPGPSAVIDIDEGEADGCGDEWESVSLDRPTASPRTAVHNATQGTSSISSSSGGSDGDLLPEDTEVTHTVRTEQAHPSDRASLMEFLESESRQLDFGSPQPKRHGRARRTVASTTPPRPSTAKCRATDPSGASASPVAILSQQMEARRRTVAQYDRDMRRTLEGDLGDPARLSALHAGLGNDLVSDVKELLTLLGVPYVESPFEADSQCGFLSAHGLVDGVISDDSDVFLFGADRVYRYAFSSTMHTEQYAMCDVRRVLGLERWMLVALAMLLGSDYTDGVHNVGIVTAMQIVDAFRDDACAAGAPTSDVDRVMRTLGSFASWVRLGDGASSGRLRTSADRSLPSAHALRLAQFKCQFSNMRLSYVLPDGFPSRLVAEAYLEASNIDRSLEPFSWGTIDVAAVTDFARRKMHWDRASVERRLGPVLERMRAVCGHQQELGAWMRRPKGPSVAVIRSQRILGAVRSLTQGCSDLKGGGGAPAVHQSPRPKSAAAWRARKRARRSGQEDECKDDV